MYVCGGVQTKYQMLHSLWWGHKTSLIKLKILQVENRFSTPDYWTSQLDLTYLHVIRTLGLQLDIVKGYLPHIAGGGGEIKIQNTVCTECIPIFQNSKSRAIGSWGGGIYSGMYQPLEHGDSTSNRPEDPSQVLEAAQHLALI